METKVHRFRFYNPKPVPIQCVSYDKNNKLLALARKNGSIEIWDVNFAPFLIKCIPGGENSSVEALAWVHERLLSTGLGAALVEWDLENSCIKKSVMLTGYAAWCLDVDEAKTIIAVGTEQGYVNIYSVNNGDIVYKKLFDKQEGRILCCKFNKLGNTLVTGSINTIRVWDVNTGHATCRISCTRRGEEVIVWSIGILSDNTIVSGDSYGRLTIWDGTVGDQIETFVTHKADILTLVISDDENSIYCSGVDPVITMFKKVENTDIPSEYRWVKNIQRNIHEHDVRALAINKDRLISVGADGYVTLSSYPPKKVMRIPPMLPMPRTAVSAEKKLLLLRFNNHLEIWKLGSYAVNNKGDVIINTGMKQHSEESDNQQLEKDTEIPFIKKQHHEEKQRTLQISEEPIKISSIQTKGKKDLVCCNISPNGELIVYSTESDVRMLKLDEDQGNISLQKLPVNELKCCDRVTFSEDSKLMIATKGTDVYIMLVDADVGATLIQTISTKKHLKNGSILHIALSKHAQNGLYIAAADSKGEIAVWVKRAKKFEYLLNLPKYSCVPSAMVIHNMMLIVTYVDQEVIQYDLDQQKLCKSKTDNVTFWRGRKMAANDIIPHPARDALIFTDETAMWVLDRQKMSENYEPQAKRKQKGAHTNGVNIMPVKYLAGFHWLGANEAVIVETLPEQILMQLPPVLKKKTHNMVESK
ncbi:U3 small nucleolar RNA-associated protein 4 homolog [Pieris napi]|uniref:U3 small nucleolar RNA-associated protein 4 homolog n=1 Tax=Pieris napi TaxID=78633 RepID=UPI001FB88BAC|nr:U3 small nucleolar RNA-associated protein 4 homolog [Pieris napi]